MTIGKKNTDTPEILIRGENAGFWKKALDIDIDPVKTVPDEAERQVVRGQARYYTSRGVILRDLSNFFFEGLPSVGKGSVIYPGVFLDKKSVIGNNVTLFPNCYIENSNIADSSVILPGSVITDSSVGSGTRIGPYSHLRNGVVIESGARVGNFVEMKKSTFGAGSKAMHLSYIGDAEVGREVNIGAGTITCNYDGVNKNPTTIRDNAFIGSGTELVAPVTVGEKSYIAAGSTINEDVPPSSLAIARQRQRIIKGWADRKRKKKRD